MKERLKDILDTVAGETKDKDLKHSIPKMEHIMITKTKNLNFALLKEVGKLSNK